MDVDVSAEPTAAAPRRSGVGCLSVFGAFVVAAVLGELQIRLLIQTWVHCAGGVAREVAVDFAPGQWADLDVFGLAERILVYGLALLAGLYAADAVTKTPSKGKRFVLTWSGGLLCCLVAFAVDYTVSNGTNALINLPGVCPGGHPRWWPF